MKKLINFINLKNIHMEGLKVEYLIVYKWMYNNEILNHYYEGKIRKIDLQKVENEIRNISDEYEEDLVFINIIQLG